MNKHIVMGVHFHVSDLRKTNHSPIERRLIIINIHLIQVICFLPDFELVRCKYGLSGLVKGKKNHLLQNKLNQQTGA